MCAGSLARCPHRHDTDHQIRDGRAHDCKYRVHPLGRLAAARINFGGGPKTVLSVRRSDNSTVVSTTPVTAHVDSDGWLGSSDYTDGLHPNEQGSGNAARALVTALQKIGLP
jgi:hypothetical protein